MNVTLILIKVKKTKFNGGLTDLTAEYSKSR